MKMATHHVSHSPCVAVWRMRSALRRENTSKSASDDPCAVPQRESVPRPRPSLQCDARAAAPFPEGRSEVISIPNAYVCRCTHGARVASAVASGRGPRRWLCGMCGQGAREGGGRLGAVPVGKESRVRRYGRHEGWGGRHTGLTPGYASTRKPGGVWGVGDGGAHQWGRRDATRRVRTS